MPPAEPFEGPGVYALFYNGPFSAYRQLVEANPKPPIYVGKAVPPGARKGLTEETGRDRSLYNRLKQHSVSIEQANNLECRH